MLRETQCLSCKHLRDINTENGWCCDAFPKYIGEDDGWPYHNAIPQEILDNEFDHTKPYPGDNGIQYE